MDGVAAAARRRAARRRRSSARRCRGVAATVVWIGLLAVTGNRWGHAPQLLLLGAAFLLELKARPRPHAAGWPAIDRWALAAAALVAARAAWIAAVPAFGWDFRYIWGLKARAFALAGGLDTGWLAWPGHGFAHPAYPPAWSFLIAAGVVLGASAGAAAAAWQALLAAALAAACWELAAGASSWARALAAVAAACSPALLDPVHSGYAEPLLAFLAAAALLGLRGLPERAPGSAALLVLAAGTLALVKHEGLALAVALVIGAAVAAGVRRALPAAAVVVAATFAWQLVVPAGLAAGDADLVPSLARAAANAAALPAALSQAVVRTPTIALMFAAWLAVVVCWGGRELRGARLACGVWGLAVLGAYLSTTADLTWHLATSADRVLAVPLPAVLSLVLAARFTPADGRSAPASSRGGSPSG